MLLRKFRAVMDLGRVQGISLTAGVSLVGSITANSAPRFFVLLSLVLVSAFAHPCGAAINELWDIELDATSKGLVEKPLVKGIFTTVQVKFFCIVSGSIALTMAFLIFGFLSFIAILLSCLWVTWYCSFGKRTFGSFEFSFALAYPAYGLFGALATGEPTMATLIFMLSIALMSIFAQWENGLKDVKNDRKHHIPSFAVVSGVSVDTGLKSKEAYFFYGISLKILLLIICTIPIFLYNIPISYVLILFIAGFIGQSYVLRSFLGKHERDGYVKKILIDVLLSWLLVSAIIIPIAGEQVYLGLTSFIILGYFLGSMLQSGAEYKFQKFMREETVG